MLYGCTSIQITIQAFVEMIGTKPRIIVNRLVDGHQCLLQNTLEARAALTANLWPAC
jgi:hypothetical protein